MSKKFFIYCNDSTKSQQAKRKLASAFRKLGCTISPDAQNIVVLGGDGTFVHAYNTYAKKNVKMVLINTGLVGFYSIDLKLDAKAIIKYFDNDNNFYKPDVVACKAGKKTYYAINEILVEGINTISADIAINGNHYEWFWGSGLCFCTKTGSTGLNKSLKNAILLTKSKIWEMSEVSPLAHAKYLSIGNAVVLDGKQEVELTNLKANGQMVLMNDGYEHQIDCKESIKFSLKTLSAQIGFYKELKPYLNKLQKVFIIGEKK